MLPNELVVDSNTVSLSSLADGRSIRTKLGDSTLATPYTLTISRNQTGKGAKAIDSYLVRLDNTVATEVDASDNVQATQTLSVYLVVKVPRGYLQSATRAATMAKALADFVKATNVSGSTAAVINRVLNGEL